MKCAGNGASFSVAGFGSTNVTVQFAPSSAGGFTNAVTFATANGGDVINTVSGTGGIVPMALFTASPTNGAAPLAVTFTDNSTGTITNWAWDFGDNRTSSKRNPNHVYANPGNYTVSLTVTGLGGKSTKVRANYISAELPPSISVVTPNGGEIWPQGSTTDL